MDNRCTGEHRMFVAEVIGIEAEGKVVVITVCTQCGVVNFDEKQVSGSGAPLRMLKEEKVNATKSSPK